MGQNGRLLQGKTFNIIREIQFSKNDTSSFGTSKMVYSRIIIFFFSLLKDKDKSLGRVFVNGS